MRKRASHFLVQLVAALLLCVAPALAQTPKDLPTLTALDRELKGGETHSYRILLSANQFLYAAVDQKDIDIVTAIFGPDGKQLTDSDSPNDRWGPEPILWVASVPGEYRVDVRSPNSKAPAGRYEIKILALREATQIDKDHVAAELAFEEGRKLRLQQTAAAKRAAIEKYESALPLFQAAGDKYREALTLHSIGIAYYPLNETRKALDYFNRARVLAVAISDARLEAAIETWTGGMLDILGDVGKALEHFQRALALARTGGSRLAEGSALVSIGNIYNNVADWQKSIEFNNQALLVFRSIESKQNIAIALNNIGIAYFFIGEYQKALDYLHQSLPLLREGGDKNSEALTLLNIGRINRRLGEYEKARGYYSQVQTIQKETGNRSLEGETLDEIGLAYSAEGQNDKAVEFHRQAVQIQHAIGNLRREALALNNLGDDYNLLGQPDKAQEQFTAALSTLRAAGDLRGAAASLEGIARAEQQRGNLAEARKYIEESLNLRETVRLRSGSLQLRASYRATLERAYEFYIDLLMQQHAKDPAHGYDAEALAASERGRARSLLERLSEASIDIRQGVDASLIDKERDLSLVLNAKAQREMQLKARRGNPDDIVVFEREMSALEDEYQQVQAAIRKSSPQYAGLTQPHPLSLKEIQQQLDPNSVLLEYALGKDRSYVWLVTTDALKTYQLPKRVVIEALATQVSESLSARSVVKSLETTGQRTARIVAADAEFRHASKELSWLILSPVALEFGNRRLIIVADGALQYVPFAALSFADGGGYRPLVLSHEVVSLPSASAFALQRRSLENRKPAAKAVAVIADPVFSVADARLKTVARREASETN
jgi:tetratricopeptide (TPR) repeat protein